MIFPITTQVVCTFISEVWFSVVGGDRTVATGGLAASPLDTAAVVDGGEVTEVLAATLGFGLGFGLGGVELRMKGLSATTEVPFRSAHWTLIGTEWT